MADGYNIDNIEEIEYCDKNIHPDLIVAFKL
jgi:hypothetical protein